ncbi:MAG: anaerobic magnesium-protoporphyrin IX monomethyl ester cyclase [Planctomycetota bacterium]|jgi:anaerobic magnesium-protoporphyrin IX monomethyl ester cyclase
MSLPSEFPVSLIFPPQGHFTQPYLALPCLKAWLGENGFQNVLVQDLSIDAYDHFLSAPYLAYAAQKVQKRSALMQEQGQEALPFESMRAWRSAVESELTHKSLIGDIERCKDVVRGEKFYNPDEYVPATRVIYQGLRLVSAAHFPSEITPHNFTMRYANDRSKEVMAGTLDEDENPFIKFYREQVLPGLIQRQPKVVGLSVIYGSQLIPALTLGRMIKQALPDCHITAGGGFLAYIGKKLMSAPGIEDCLDSLIFHEGEAPLLALCETLLAGQSDPGEVTDLSEVGSLLWIDRREGGATAVRNSPAHPVHLNNAPIPDFSDLPLKKYFSPEVVLPYDINRGCYYGECAFCTLPTVIGPGYRTRSAETISEHIATLRDTYQTTHFNFITDCMPPGMIRDLPQALIDSEAGITWWCDARVEPKAYNAEGAKRLFDSGCRKLLFGFETATPRLLKMMMKGQSLKSMTKVVQSCADAGISVTLYAMVGFPSETKEEAQATLQYIVDSVPQVREVSLQTFHIDEVALTYREPERFGIKILNDEEADLQLYHDYESEVGMTQAEAAEMFEDMMTSFSENLPIFSGDSILYFMQKSHYFLHLSRGTSPDEFAEMCKARCVPRPALQPGQDLRVCDGLRFLPTEFSYREVIQTLQHPLARAARPDFLTGRFVGDAEELAGRELPAADRRSRVLLYDPMGHEFIEVSPDGAKLLRAIRAAGSLEILLENRKATPATRDSLRRFADELYRLGVLVSTADEPIQAYVMPRQQPAQSLEQQETPS